ncbi:MAG: tyrosine-protein phosphatase [Pseudomonadota bacterium]
MTTGGDQRGFDPVLALDGALNLRDFGGLASRHGGKLKRGLLYRSGALFYLTKAGERAVQRLDLGLICDLRRPEERDLEPSPDGLTRETLLLPIDPGGAVELREKLESGLSVAGRIAYMTRLTGELTREHAADYRRMFDGLLHLVGNDEGSFLVHCSAGKDRTGVACMLIQHALGVDAADIRTDYLLTNRTVDYEGFVLPRLAVRLQPGEMPDREAIMALAGVREEYLAAAYAGVLAQHADMDAYLRNAVGLTDGERTALIERYVE